jgi:adenosylmethionine---8-amino-7-oxononanoate aminotransferase
VADAEPTSRARAQEWLRRDQGLVWHGFTQMDSYAEHAPVVVERAEGRELIDVDGNRYLDAISSLWVTTLGHGVAELDEAVRRQLDKVAHSTMLGNTNTVVVELAEALAEVVPVDKPHFLFASDGASAVEQALKIAFQYWVNLGETGRTRYLALGNAYHGDTVGSLSLGDGGFGTSLFDPLRFPVVRTPGYDDPGWLDKALATLAAHAGELTALCIEPLVQGAAGMLVADPDHVGALARAAAAAGVLVIADEVATGFGRTGRLFASEWCGVRPDVLCLGKGLTGGYLPMSVTVAAGPVYDAFLGEPERALFHGHSYGGNALAAAVALEHLRLLRDGDVLDNVRARSDQLAALMARGVLPHPAVAAVRRRGLMTGVELVGAAGRHLGREVCDAAVARGVLIRPLGDVVVIMPPLTVTADEIERIVAVLLASLRDATGDTRPVAVED